MEQPQPQLQLQKKRPAAVLPSVISSGSLGSSPERHSYSSWGRMAGPEGQHMAGKYLGSSSNTWCCSPGSTTTTFPACSNANSGSQGQTGSLWCDGLIGSGSVTEPSVHEDVWTLASRSSTISVSSGGPSSSGPLLDDFGLCQQHHPFSSSTPVQRTASGLPNLALPQAPADTGMHAAFTPAATTLQQQQQQYVLLTRDPASQPRDTGAAAAPTAALSDVWDVPTPTPTLPVPPPGRQQHWQQQQQQCQLAQAPHGLLHATRTAISSPMHGITSGGLQQEWWQQQQVVPAPSPLQQQPQQQHIQPPFTAAVASADRYMEAGRTPASVRVRLGDILGPEVSAKAQQALQQQLLDAYVSGFADGEEAVNHLSEEPPSPPRPQQQQQRHEETLDKVAKRCCLTAGRYPSPSEVVASTVKIAAGCVPQQQEQQQKQHQEDGQQKAKYALLIADALVGRCGETVSIIDLQQAEVQLQAMSDEDLLRMVQLVVTKKQHH